MTGQEKLFEFFYILLQKRKVTASEIASHFEVTPRTVYRWCDSLSIAGIPVITLQGKGGGITLSENYTIESTVFSDEEKNAVASGISALANLAEDSDDSTRSASEKIKALVSSVSDWVRIDFTTWTTPDDERKKIFSTAKKAILNSRLVEFAYYGYGNKTSRRTVHPWQMVFKGQSWYLLGFCEEKKAPRFFKLSRIKDISLTEKKSTVRYTSEFEEAVSGSYEDTKNCQILSVTAEIDNTLIPLLLDQISGTEILGHGEMASTVRFNFPDMPWTVSVILSYGAGMKILEPESLRERMVAETEKILRRYGKM